MCTSERQRCALIHHRQYRLARVDVSVYSAMFGLRLYILCVILRRSTWTPDRVTWSCCSPVKYKITDFVGSSCLCGRAVRRSSQSWLQAVISPERAVQDNVSPCFSGCSRPEHSTVRCPGVSRHEQAHRLMASMGLFRLDDPSLWTDHCLLRLLLWPSCLREAAR